MPASILQTAKIVGAASQDYWSQNHIFLPEDKEKKALYGSLLVSFSLKGKKEGIDITSFGKEIISRFHEIYYSSAEKEALIRLKLSIKNLVNEFNDQVDLQIASAVVLEKAGSLIGYFALLGEGKIVILRENQLVTLLNQSEEGIKTSSGYLKDQDLLVLATAQFSEIISHGSLKAALESKEPKQAVEALAPSIHAQENNSQTAAILFRVDGKGVEFRRAESSFGRKAIEKKEVVKEESVEEEQKPAKSSEEHLPARNASHSVAGGGGQGFLANLVVLVKNIPFLTKKVLRDFRQQPNIFIKDKQRRVRAKKTTLSVAFILIALLLASVILGSKRKTLLKESERVQQIFEEVEYKYEQATSLVELNPLRARSLLNEAKELIKEAEGEVKRKEGKEKLSQLLSQIESALEKVAKEYKLEAADVFLDLGLVKEGFKGNDWDFTDDVLQILDQEKGTILEVEIENKGAKVSAGGEKLEGVEKLGTSQGRIFALKKANLVVVDADRGEVIEDKEEEDWGRVVDLVGFAGNAYLLDVSKGKIWKYVQTDKGLSSAINYLQAESLDLEDGLSLAIDGSVWLLFSDGTIVKFTRGIKDPFSVSGLDKNFQEPEKMYTDENLDNLYVLDRQNTRVVVINKETGEYVSQYVWPGMAGVLDIFASEEQGKILLLTGERIYEIEIRG